MNLIDDENEVQEDFRNHLATADKKGRRRWLFPKKVDGKWFRRREVVSWLLLGIMFIGPFIQINGNPLLMFNIVERRFSILGPIFWPQDAAIFAVASLTDWLDGYLARRRRQVTWLGQVLDPIADKLLTSAAFISLVQLGLAPAWMVALIIGREFAITALRSLAYTRGITIPASRLGKIKMGSQVTAILLLILGWGPMPWLAPIGYISLWAVMLLAVASAVDYYRRFQRLLNARVTDVNVARERRVG
jgi:CDP-diacylglycerol--glycerol-3-phosphate 3-phosphatidyltransferase